MIKKILVANRGEIAMRIFRTCRVMNISTVAVYTHVDRGALHVRYAEEAYCISGSPEDTSYLKPELILSIAKKTGAAIHPGYGFLSCLLYTSIEVNCCLMISIFSVFSNTL